jgi:sugar O-acyltransferase (sialic acid O-acetyltransferase NeuD family)
MTKLNQEQIIIFGAGGHSKVVIDVIEKQGIYNISKLLDEDPDLLNTEVYGYNVSNQLSETDKQQCKKYIIAIGNNKVRLRIEENTREVEFKLAQPIIHPSVQLARGIKIGNGTVLLAGVIINSDTVIAENIIINTNVAIDHDCIIESGVHIAPGSTICGGVSIGKGTLIGAGSVIVPGVTIGEDVVIGAGSTVLGDIPDNVTAFGTPAEIKN